MGILLDGILRLDNLLAGKKNLISVVNKHALLDSKKVIIFATHTSYQLNKGDLLLFDLAVNYGFQVVVVTNCDSISALMLEPVTWARQNVHHLLRKNRGLDLAAHRDVLRLLPPGVEELILINSSVYWDPRKFWNLYLSLSSPGQTPLIWAATESLQRGRHFQSFLFFALGSESVDGLKIIFNSMKNWRFKRTVINFGERGIPKIARKSDIEIKALFPYNFVVEQFQAHSKSSPDFADLDHLLQNLVPLNPTQHFWSELIQAGAPFLKKNLISLNPADLKNIPSEIPFQFL